MTNSKHYYSLLAKAIDAYKRGQNITEVLRAESGTLQNSSEIIEIAYDLQAGSYVEYVEANMAKSMAYAQEVAATIGPHISSQDVLLDVGTGEITTLSLVLKNLSELPKKCLGFDISLSRLLKGLNFAEKNMGEAFGLFTPFVADLAAIPLVNGAANITISSHAIEPNGGREKELLSELFRVTKDKLLLFEPSYHDNSEEGRARMKRLGYITDLEDSIEALGGKLVEKMRVKNVSNPLNPTYCFVVIPPSDASKVTASVSSGDAIFSVPGVNSKLSLVENTYFSETYGLCYPIIRGIPILRPHTGVLASAMLGDVDIK